MKFSIVAQAILAIPALTTAIPEPVGVTEGKSSEMLALNDVEY